MDNKFKETTENMLTYYNLRTFKEISELNSDEKLKFSIPDFINLVSDEIKSKQPQFLFNEDKDLMGYAYFFVITHYLEKEQEEKEKPISIRQFAINYYNNTEPNKEYAHWKDIEKEFVEKTYKVIKKLTSQNDIYKSKLSRYPKEKTNLKNPHILYKRNVEELTLFFDEYNKDSTYLIAVMNNKIKNKKFKEFNDYVHLHKSAIMNSNDEFKNKRLYGLEKYLHFEHIKNMCATVHKINEMNKKLLTIEKNTNLKLNKYNLTDDIHKKTFFYKKNAAKDLIATMDILDIKNRFKYVNSYNLIQNEKELIFWKFKLNVLIDQAYEVFIGYLLYLLEEASSQGKIEIYELIENEKEFYKTIYIRDKVLNQNFCYKPDYLLDYAKDDYCSPFEIDKDFTEDDYHEVMEALQESNLSAINEKSPKNKKTSMEELRKNKTI